MTRMKQLHVLGIESLGKLVLGRLRSILKNVMKTYSTEVENVMKTYSMEVENEIGLVACSDLGLIVSGNEVLCAAALLLISALSLRLCTL